MNAMTIGDVSIHKGFIWSRNSNKLQKNKDLATWTPLKSGVNSGATEGLVAPAPLVEHLEFIQCKVLKGGSVTGLWWQTEYIRGNRWHKYFVIVNHLVMMVTVHFRRFGSFFYFFIYVRILVSYILAIYLNLNLND